MPKSFTCCKCGKREFVARWLNGEELLSTRICHDCHYYSSRVCGGGGTFVWGTKYCSIHPEGFFRTEARPYDFEIWMEGLDDWPVYVSRVNVLSDVCPDWFIAEWKSLGNLVAKSAIQLDTVTRPELRKDL